MPPFILILDPAPVWWRGMGKPGFPIPLRKGLALPNPPAGEGVGEPGFPIPLSEDLGLR